MRDVRDVGEAAEVRVRKHLYGRAGTNLDRGRAGKHLYQRSAKYLYRQASSHLAARCYEQAVEEFTALLAQRPDHAPALAARAAAYRMLEEDDKALMDASLAVALSPGLAWAYATRGAVHRARGNSLCALADLNRAIELDPEYEWCLAFRGEVHLEMGWIDQALADFAAALELDPDNDWALVGRTAAYFEAGDPDKAAAAFKEGTTRHRDRDWTLGRTPGQITYRLMGADLSRYLEDGSGRWLRTNWPFRTGGWGRGLARGGRFGGLLLHLVPGDEKDLVGVVRP